MPNPLSLIGFIAFIIAGFGLGLGFALANGLLALIGAARRTVP